MTGQNGALVQGTTQAIGCSPLAGYGFSEEALVSAGGRTIY